MEGKTQGVNEEGGKFYLRMSGRARVNGEQTFFGVIVLYMASLHSFTCISDVEECSRGVGTTCRTKKVDKVKVELEHAYFPTPQTVAAIQKSSRRS